MIVREKGEQYDGSHRVVYYTTDDSGKCVPEHVKSEFDEQIASYYELRVAELARLQDSLLKGEISPIGFFVQYCNMTVQDTAARVRTSPGKVRKHMTPKGFETVKVGTLLRYARVFDIAVGDFFQFTHLAGDLPATVQRFHDRLIARITVGIDTRGDQAK